MPLSLPPPLLMLPLTCLAAMNDVPPALATAADIRTRTIAFLNRREKARENARVLTTAFLGACVLLLRCVGTVFESMLLRDVAVTLDRSLVRTGTRAYNALA
jgi:hypothetical protein